MNKIITVESSDVNISAELSLKTFWVGNIVYPSAAVLRIQYRNYPVIADMPLRLDDGHTLYGLDITGVEESCGERRLGPTLQKIIGLQERGGSGRKFSVTLRLSNISVFFNLSCVSDNHANQTDLPLFFYNCPVVSSPGATPILAYIGPGAIAASWRKEGNVHLLIFNRPGMLAEMHFNLYNTVPAPLIETGADGCRILYALLPFCKVAPDSAVYGDAIRLSYRCAFDQLLEHYSCEDDDFWVMRGDPGEFVIAARRLDSKWIVCGLTNKAQILTVRFEELWLRLPPEMRTLEWRAAIQRDSVLDEAGDVMEESFDSLAPDTRIALDLKKNGGFVIEFAPRCKEKEVPADLASMEPCCGVIKHENENHYRNKSDA